MATFYKKIKESDRGNHCKLQNGPVYDPKIINSIQNMKISKKTNWTELTLLKLKGK